jgi:hypothetical protein
MSTSETFDHDLKNRILAQMATNMASPSKTNRTARLTHESAVCVVLIRATSEDVAVKSVDITAGHTSRNMISPKTTVALTETTDRITKCVAGFSSTSPTREKIAAALGHCDASPSALTTGDSARETCKSRTNARRLVGTELRRVGVFSQELRLSSRSGVLVLDPSAEPRLGGASGGFAPVTDGRLDVALSAEPPLDRGFGAWLKTSVQLCLDRGSVDIGVGAIAIGDIITATEEGGCNRRASPDPV